MRVLNAVILKEVLDLLQIKRSDFYIRDAIKCAVLLKTEAYLIEAERGKLAVQVVDVACTD